MAFMLHMEIIYNCEYGLMIYEITLADNLNIIPNQRNKSLQALNISLSTVILILNIEEFDVSK